MKHVTLSLSLILFSCLGQAAQVDLDAARSAGAHYLQGTSLRSDDGTPVALDLAVRMTSAGINPADAEDVSTYYYVFNLHGGSGFVIVAGDDAVTPILGYSDRNGYDPAHLPENMAKWMERYKQAIADAIAANASADDIVQARWQELLHPAADHLDVDDRSVNPLLTTLWDQAPNYNALCPGGSVTGCVATATAQVMKFWNYPATGSGFHSYEHPQYGTLSANFASTTFDWGSMPNSISGSNTAIATLMYAVGVAVDMNYSPQVSGAWVISSHTNTPPNCAEYALRTYFGYDQGMQGLGRAAYSDANWVNLLKAELDAGRPIVYDGFGSGGGHCWVLDGYDNSDMFHANWGWSGNSDGYFTVDGMNPPGLGTGGGDGGFNSGQEAIVGIKPPGGSTTPGDLQLYDYVVPSPNPIYYGQAFDVTTNILNAGTTDFAGDYCAALFDAQGTFVDYVQIFSGESLPVGYVYNPPGVVFSNPGSFAFLPGQYSIGVFFRPTGGDWQQVADASGYTNMVPFTILNPNDVEMYSNMNVTSGLPLVQGSSASVEMTIANYGGSDIVADFDLSLYNMDGSGAQQIGVINDVSVPSGFWYGPLTFNTGNITVAPGSYLLALEYYTDVNGAWQLVGSTNYSNPVIVTVQAQGIQPDMYEVNDNDGSAYIFNPSYTGNTANVNTNGSNCHTATDDDFYGFDLPPGYDYTIDARIHDSYNSGNGNTYTLDGLFTWSNDGNNWDGPYDDVMGNYIYLPGGSTIHFHVAPYFQGQTGTYLLEANITRTPASGIAEEDPDENGFRLLPNPAIDQLNVEFDDLAGHVQEVSVLNAQGQELLRSAAAMNASRSTIDVSVLATGAYYVRLRTDEGVRTRSFLKAE